MEMSAESVAIVERISAYSVALVNTSMVKVDERSHSEKGIGTATAIRGKKRLFLLTVKHNLEDATISDLEFMPKPSAATVFGDSMAPIERFNVVFRRHFPISEIISCPWEDLSILLLDESFNEGQEPARHMQFFQWRDDLRSPKVGSTIAALGHPVSRTYVVADRRDGNHIDREMGILKHIMSCQVVPDARGTYVKGYDPDAHFLVDCSRILDSYEPHGFSGCGWWRGEDGGPGIWTANPIFAGVETSYVRSSKLLVSIRPEIVCKWLDEIGI